MKNFERLNPLTGQVASTAAAMQAADIPGYGRFGGKAGIDSFTELRWITVETQPGHYPI